MLVPLDSRSLAQSSRVLQVHALFEMSVFSSCLCKTSGPALPAGKGEKLQLPVTSVVTPWYALLSPPGSSSRVRSEWP